MKNTARFYDFYLVTTFGAIYSFLTKQNVPMHLNNGYYEVYLRHPEKATLRIKLHRVVALCFLPPIAGKRTYKPQEWKQETFHPTTNKPVQKKQVPQSKETPQNKFNKSRAGVESDLIELESGKQVGDKCGGKLTKKTKVKKHYFGGKIDSIVVNDSLNRLTGRWK